jgi:flagellin-like protein
MAISTTPTRGVVRPRAENDIFTVLIVVAFLFVLAATIYVGYRALTLFGSLLPPPGL